MGKLIPKFPYRRNARYTTMQGKWMNEQCQLCKGELWQKGTNLPFDEKGTEGKDEEKGEPRFMMLLYSLVTILLSHQAWWAFWSFSIWFKTLTLSVDISRAFSSLKRPFHLKRQNNFYKSSPFSSTISPPFSPYMRILSDQNRKQVDHENKNILFRTLFSPKQGFLFSFFLYMDSSSVSNAKDSIPLHLHQPNSSRSRKVSCTVTVQCTLLNYISLRSELWNIVHTNTIYILYIVYTGAPMTIQRLFSWTCKPRCHCHCHFGFYIDHLYFIYISQRNIVQQSTSPTPTTTP